MNFNSELYKAPKNSFIETNTNKSQIILYGSKTSFNNYFQKLNILETPYPTFSVDRKGKVYEHYNSDFYSNFFTGKNEKQKITIVLENLGWLKYSFETNSHINWNNESVINQKEIFEKEWRNNRYWHKYNTTQVKETANLCNFLIDKHNISPDCIGYNNFDKNVDTYQGIVTASNFDNIETEINPSFDFKTFLKNLKL